MMIEKHVQKKLSKVVEDPEKGKYAEYVLLVLGGSRKGEALKQVFPERHMKAIQRASGNTQLHAAELTKEIRHVERSKICKELYEQSHKTWWIQFLEKKNRLYENLYDMALDKAINPRERVSASKVMLEHMPSFQEDINIKVEVKQSKEDFVSQLREMQIALHKQANKDAIDVELETEGN
jgi:hypothetical protein